MGLDLNQPVTTMVTGWSFAERVVGYDCTLLVWKVCQTRVVAGCLNRSLPPRLCSVATELDWGGVAKI